MDVEARSSDAVRVPEVAVPGTPGGEKRVNPSPKSKEPAEAKKPKAESPSRKREAEEEMVAGLPTIRDCMLVAALPTEGEEKEVKFYDERPVKRSRQARCTKEERKS